MSTGHTAVVLLLASALAACSKSGTPARADAAESGSAATAAATGAADADKPNSTIHLVVAGGPNAGTYDAKATSGGCSYGLAGTGAWGNQYSIETKDPKAFSSLQLIVPDAKGAAHGTTQFQMTVGFGPLFQGKSYDVNTRANAAKKEGKGSLTVEDHGSTAKVTFDAETDAGVKLSGTIDCLSVMRAG